MLVCPPYPHISAQYIFCECNICAHVAIFLLASAVKMISALLLCTMYVLTVSECGTTPNEQLKIEFYENPTNSPTTYYYYYCCFANSHCFVGFRVACVFVCAFFRCRILERYRPNAPVQREHRHSLDALAPSTTTHTKT